MTGRETDEGRETEKAAEEPRRQYVAPVLTVYGDVEKLTLDLGTAGSDGLLGSQLL